MVLESRSLLLLLRVNTVFDTRVQSLLFNATCDKEINRLFLALKQINQHPYISRAFVLHVYSTSAPACDAPGDLLLYYIFRVCKHSFLLLLLLLYRDGELKLPHFFFLILAVRNLIQQTTIPARVSPCTSFFVFRARSAGWSRPNFRRYACPWTASTCTGTGLPPPPPCLREKIK